MDDATPSSRPGLNIPFLEEGRADQILQKLSFADRLHDETRNHFVAAVGEFLGTFFFLLLGLSGAQVATITGAGLDNQAQTILFVSLSFGFSLAVNVWVMFRVSGGLFNPAVTVGMCLVGALPWVRGLILILSQMISAIVASFVVQAVFPGPISLTKLNAASGIEVGQGFVVEMFLTYQFVMSIMMMAGEKHRATHLAPVGIGLSLFVAELSGVYYTGGSLNPARSFGPAVVTGNFGDSHWIYWAGPFAGSLLAAGTYKLLKVLEYEKANPGQDAHAPAKESGTIRLEDNE